MFHNPEEMERRQLAAERHRRLAKRNWRIVSYCVAILALLLAGFAWRESGYWQGWRDGRASAERKTP